MFVRVRAQQNMWPVSCQCGVCVSLLSSLTRSMDLHPTSLPKSCWQNNLNILPSKATCNSFEKKHLQPSKFHIRKCWTFNNAFMLVVISALQFFPSSLLCVRPCYLFSRPCLHLSRLFVLRVRKLREKECTCPFISNDNIHEATLIQL